MCGMSDRPEQRPEGKLIAAALKRMRMSQRKAADRAGISENHWRNIVKGYQTVSAGVTAPIKGAPETVARMAQVVGVTAEELADAEREDAANELRTLPPLQEPEPSPSVEELADRLARMEETVARQQQENAELRRMLREISGKDSTSAGAAEDRGETSVRKAI